MTREELLAAPREPRTCCRCQTVTGHYHYVGIPAQVECEPCFESHSAWDQRECGTRQVVRPALFPREHL